MIILWYLFAVRIFVTYVPVRLPNHHERPWGEALLARQSYLYKSRGEIGEENVLIQCPMHTLK